MRFRIAAALAATLALSACASEPLRTTPLSPQALSALAAVRVDPPSAAAMLNAYRVSHGLGRVRLDPALSAMAQRQANAMVAANALSHDVAGGFPARLVAAGIDAPRAAENVGGGYYSTGEAMTGWRESPEHDANLLMPQATRFGIAIAKDARTSLRVYWAMEVAAEPEKPTPGSLALSSAGPQ